MATIPKCYKKRSPKIPDFQYAIAFQDDPSGEYLKPTSLQGMRLQNGEYVAIPYEMRPAAISTLPDGILSFR